MVPNLLALGSGILGFVGGSVLEVVGYLLGEVGLEGELPAKIGRCSKKPPGRNFDFRAKSS